MEVTPKLIGEILTYRPEDGKFFWKERDVRLFKSKGSADHWNRRFAGIETFKTKMKLGYLYGLIFNKKYYSHRVAWASYYGVWPDGEIDHINGNKSDNRIENLRDVDHITNHRNMCISMRNSTGVLGVYVDSRNGVYRAKICVEGESVNLGGFSTIDDAESARLKADAKFGFHKNHGRKP